MKTSSLFKCLLLTLCLAPTLAISQAKNITPEFITGIKSASEVAIDPSGKTIAYTLFVPGDEKDKPGTRNTELLLLFFEGGAARKYIEKPSSAAGISWNKEGTELFFQSRRGSATGSQIYSISVAGGEARLVTKHDQSIGSYAVSPDGKWIAFTSTDVKTKQEKQDEEAGKDWIIPGEGYRYTRLYVQNLATGEIKKVFSENLHVHSFVWSNDNTTLFFQAAETPETDDGMMYLKIYSVKTNEGKPSVFCKTEGKLGPMSVSPDGSLFAFLAATDISDPLAQSLFVVPVTGGNPKNLTENYEASCMNLWWSDSKTVLLQTAEGCYTNLVNVDATTGAKKTVYANGLIIRSLSLNSATGKIAMTASSPAHSTEVFSFTLAKPEPKKLTDHNPELKDVRLAKQEVIEWTGADGWKIQGILTYPLNYKTGQLYPLVLQIHGGPEGISFNGWNTRSVYPVQLFAANDYFVLEPNYRGSMGRGVKFSKADHKDLGGKEYDDVLAGIDELVKKKLVDGNKVATGGFSYGGYFSAWGATKYSNRFKAAIVGAGISNWISFTGTTDIIHENSLVHWNLWMNENLDMFWDRSPLKYIGNCNTPTLVIQGEKDDRVPPGQSYELYNAVKLKNVPTQLVVYKRQPHGINERAAQIDFMNRCVNWCNKYVKSSTENSTF